MSATYELPDTGYPNSLRPELHKALKAHGIDYWVAQGITFWNRDDGCECLAYGYKANGVPKLAVKVVGFTDPAQAVATMVCVDSNTGEAIRNLLDKLDTELCNAGCVIECETREERKRLIDAVKDKYAQAIAATVDGTCKNVCANISEFTCSECGFNCDLTSWISLFDGDSGRHRHHHHGTPNYCPNCGRKVMAE